MTTAEESTFNFQKVQLRNKWRPVPKAGGQFNPAPIAKGATLISIHRSLPFHAKISDSVFFSFPNGYILLQTATTDWTKSSKR